MFKDQYKSFAEAALMNRKGQRRIKGLRYSNCMLISSQGVDWSADFIGVEFLAILKFRVHPFTKNEYLEEVQPVLLTDSRMQVGRTIKADFVSLL